MFYLMQFSGKNTGYYKRKFTEKVSCGIHSLLSVITEGTYTHRYIKSHIYTYTLHTKNICLVLSCIYMTCNCYKYRGNKENKINVFLFSFII